MLFTFNSLPLINFIEIQEKKDFSYLVKDGEHSDEEIAKAWGEIIERFDNVTKGNNPGELFALIQEARSLHKINAMQGIYIIWMIDPIYRNEKLKELGIKCKNRDSMLGKLNNAINMHKIQQQQNKVKGDGETDWWNIISLFSEMTPPIVLDVNTVTLAYFAHMIKNMTKKPKKVKK